MLKSKSIGNKIAEARKKINLSQAELSRQISISPQAVGKWERGESMPDITTLNRLAEIFRVDLNYFSDNFQTNETANSTNENLAKQTIETQESRPKKKFGWNWDMSKGNWVDADFSGLKNLQEKFSGSNMKNCKFIGSELTALILNGNNIDNCDFYKSDLRNCKIQASYLSKCTFSECSLIDASFDASEIKNCNFIKTDFSGAEFSTGNFQNNNVEGAIWKLTSFKTTHLADLIFTEDMDDCTFEYCSFSKVAFKGATLKNTFFKCKTLKNIQFFDSQADRMTYEFLKNGKANLTGLTLIP